MKKIENLVLSACAFTVMILFLFYLFAVIGQFTEPTITFPTFLLIFGFSAIIAVTSMILRVERLKMFTRIAIHYASLLIAFTVVFLTSGNLASGGTPIVFSAVVVFTFLYGIIFTATYFICKGLRSADRKISNRQQKNATASKKSEYKSLYSSKD